MPPVPHHSYAAFCRAAAASQCPAHDASSVHPVHQSLLELARLDEHLMHHGVDIGMLQLSCKMHFMLHLVCLTRALWLLWIGSSEKGLVVAVFLCDLI